MDAVMWAAVLALAIAAAPAEAPPPQTVVFYNARLALREQRPADALKLWLLRNSLRQRGERSQVDGDFRSVVWAALGEAAVCPDGFPRDDEGGAGVWPLAFHNWLVRSMGKGPAPEQPPPWDVFEAGRQQRFVSLHDVLSAEELRSVAFFRTGCFYPHTATLDSRRPRWVDLDDRLDVGLLMRELLIRSLTTLRRDKVASTAAIEARIFDLDLALAELQARRARRDAGEKAQQARGAGASKEAVSELRSAVATRWTKSSRQAEFLRRSLTWRPDEWLSLSPDRRLALFAQARPLADDPASRDALVLGIIDRLIDAREGEEVEQWIGFLDAREAPALRAEVTSGARGQRLLELEPETGFRARGEVALHRGVAFLQAGAFQDALRSFAFALHHAEESRGADLTAGLARRWLSYVLSRFETTDEVLATLRALVPRRELNPVLEDLLWRAALRADRTSFDRVVEQTHRGGSLDARVELLRPLAQGNPGATATRLHDAAKDEPHSVLRFIRQYLDSLEVEDGDVRRAHVATLTLLMQVTARVLDGAEGKTNAQSRSAEELLRRGQAILDGLSHLDLTEQGKARALSIDRETYAGSIRLAPSDPLPWPFAVPEPQAPSAFSPLKLVPVEWRDGEGRLVFGWRVTE